MNNLLLLRYGLLTKYAKPYFQVGLMSDVLTIVNFWHAVCRTLIWAKSDYFQIRKCRFFLLYIKNWFDKRCYARLKMYSAGNYMFKVSNRNIRTRCEICSRSDAIGVILVSLLLTLNIFHTLFLLLTLNR